MTYTVKRILNWIGQRFMRAGSTTLVIDTSKARAEFERMHRGEIPYEYQYLRELIEFSDPGNVAPADIQDGAIGG